MLGDAPLSSSCSSAGGTGVRRTSYQFCMAKKNSLEQRRPEPPSYKEGDYETRYNNVSTFRTVTLDEGSFLYVWDWMHAHWKNNTRRFNGRQDDPLMNVINRANDAFEEQASDFVPVDVPAPKSEKGPSGKKLRCPDCNTKGPKKVLKKGRPMWKCLECEFKWPREVPAEAPRSPVEASAEDSSGSDTSERPRKRQKPAKKKSKKTKVA